MEFPPVVEKSYDLADWLLGQVRTFPRDERWLLGQRLVFKALDVLEGFIAASQLPMGDEKRHAVEKLSVRLDELRYLLRLSKKRQYVKPKAWYYGTEKVLEIGRMTGGWLRSMPKAAGKEVGATPSAHAGEE